MTFDQIKAKLSLVPNEPGCYQMKDVDNNIIYVGKAKKLKKRLSSYFRGTHTGKTAKLVSEIADFDYIVVTTEVESLVLELNLIKKYDPKYNILLRDDKSYPYIELTDEAEPRLLIIRKLNPRYRHHHLFGPYPNVSAARDTVNLLNRLYPLRKCVTMATKSCLYYDIGECLGYCTKAVDPAKIKQMKEEIMAFLGGNTTFVTSKLKLAMAEASNHLNYEKANELKTLLTNIELTTSKQRVELNDNIDRDVFGYFVLDDYIAITCLFIRGGKILEKHSQVYPLVDEVGLTLTNYIASFYNRSLVIPKEIIVPNIVMATALADYLKVKIIVPKKGTKKKLVNMALENAKITITNQLALTKKEEARTSGANDELRECLHLAKLSRIELFDNSNLFGQFNVSGMVVFIDGKPQKQAYRKYKISFDHNDDYGTMHEVIYRRYFRVLTDQLPKPDLIIVDGGSGQIKVARDVITDLHLNIPVVGLKKDDHHQTAALLAFDPIQELKIAKDSNLFYLLERMQDEVHRYTINYHRQIRSKGLLTSVLVKVDGIGEVRAEELMKQYHSLSQLKQASLASLEQLLPKATALKLKTFLDNEVTNE